MYQCRNCKKVYKTLGWFKRHCQAKQHNPVWIELVDKKSAFDPEIIRLIIREELAKLQITPQRKEPVVRITQTTTTEMPLSEYERGSRTQYAEVMKELKGYISTHPIQEEQVYVDSPSI